MHLFPERLWDEAKGLLEDCKAKGLTVATAESCTGGMLAALLTDIPGCSKMFTHGYVTYANEAKQGMIGVPKALIDQQGAVSEEVAKAMVQGALEKSGASLAVAITGIAGPDGGTKEKPVGTVHIAAGNAGKIVHQQFLFDGDRGDIRAKSTEAALAMLRKVAQG